MDVSLLIYH